LWIIPVVYGVSIVIAAYVVAATHPFGETRATMIVYLGRPVLFLHPIGTIWATIDCIRRERHPWKYLVVMWLIPMSFMWYYVEQYPRRAST